jgi:signal transduction histidine kinase
MKNDISLTRFMLVFVSIFIITMIHYGTPDGGMEIHMLHRELYFIPILLSAFWFGLKLGLTASLLVSLFYAPQMTTPGQGMGLAVFSQLLIFNLVAVLLGWLTDRRKKHHLEALKLEKHAALGRAAGIIGHEMKDLLAAMERFADPPIHDPSTEKGKAFARELGRLTIMVDNLSSFMPEDKLRLSGTDLNEVILERVGAHEKDARAAGIRLVAELDPCGCPSFPDMTRIGRVLDSLIKNALEASPEGGEVRLVSQRGGDSCRVEVRDEGPGIRPEDKPMIFSPFFTTKADGQGLDLAACRKIMSELGGDIGFESEWGGGACFMLTVPRDAEEKQSPLP